VSNQELRAQSTGSWRYYPTMSPCRIAHLLCALLALHCAAADLPSQAEYQKNWPRFRGPDGSGVCTQGEAPLNADHIAWTADVPAAGFGSPVVWGERVFLSGGDDKGCSVMCLDANSGKLLWQTSVPKADEAFEAPDQSGIAASTVATDGLRVYAVFANGDLAAVNFDGSVAWSKHLGAPKNLYGHTSSLLTWQDRVIVQFDQGDADDKLSKLYAFDGATGKVAWEQSRDVGSSWATPIVFEVAGKTQLLTLAPSFAISYSAKDGAELWRAECVDGEVTPSPVFAGGKLFIVSPTSKLQAYRPDGEGDVTKTHLEWIAEDGIPDITSPVSNGELVFLIDTSGMLSCYDAKDGKKQWQKDIEEECKASPSIVGGKLCLVTMKGLVIVVEAGREFKELARFPLNEEVFASPAFAGNKMFVRGMKHLICVGSAKP
jgi:outer membrane protein assembly factor BamB